MRQAYLAARRSLDLDPASTKARYCLARAMLHLRCYGPALEHLQAVAQQVALQRAGWRALRGLRALNRLPRRHQPPAFRSLSSLPPCPCLLSTGARIQGSD